VSVLRFKRGELSSDLLGNANADIKLGMDTFVFTRQLITGAGFSDPLSVANQRAALP
jgi:hypothetical protein